MTLNRLCVAFLTLGLALLLAGTSQATQVTFSLVGGGGQFHIGNGLALPIQQAATSGETGTVFPPLGVPVKAGPAPEILGTVAKGLIDTGTKQGYQRKLVVPVGVLSKPAGQTTVGVKFSNTTLFAVGTNLKFTWPAAKATFSTGAAAGGGGFGTHVIAANGGTMTYSNKLGKRFGGPAHFRLTSGPAAGDFPHAPVTIWLKVNGATPPCTHSSPLFGGPPKVAGKTCIVGVVLAAPAGLAGPGGSSGITVTTMGPLVGGPNIAIAKIGKVPVSGTLLPGLTPPVITKPYPLPVASNTLLPKANDAASRPGPWTTGQVIISNPAAVPAEVFTLSGKDSRTAKGGGSIQMVSGALSTRIATGPNANRGWVRLTLASPLPAPAISPAGLAAMAGLMLLGAGYIMRRRLFA